MLLPALLAGMSLARVAVIVVGVANAKHTSISIVCKELLTRHIVHSINVMVLDGYTKEKSDNLVCFGCQPMTDLVCLTPGGVSCRDYYHAL